MKRIFSKRMVLGVLMLFAVVGCSSDDDAPNNNGSLSSKDKIILNNTSITGGKILQSEGSKFNGKIKKMVSTYYDAVIEGGKVVKKGKGEVEEEYYSEKGQRIERKKFDNKGKLTRNVKYTYDEKGGLVKKEVQEDGEVRETIVENKYDSKDRCIETKSTYKEKYGTYTDLERFVYDDKNNIV
ncbi:MAG: hypothetical protein CR961_00910, partial [Polaribacter sp.]